MTETMTEETEKPSKKMPTGKPAVEAPRLIPVAMMRLVNRGAKVAGHGSTDTVEAKKRSDGSYWTIDFIPQLRHFRVTFTDTVRKSRCKVTMIHETRVDTWEPADD